MDGILIGIYITLGAMGGCVLGAIAVGFFVAKGWIRDRSTARAAMVWFGTIFFALVIVLSSLLGAHDRWWLFLYGSLMLLLPLFFLYSLRKATSRLRLASVPNWLKSFWNVQKAFGGGLFGDFANTIGVLAGVGAYQLSKADESWFWLGQFGAFLAALVGLSLVMRWILQSGKMQEGNPKSTRWYALGNFAIGIFTFLSITTPTSTANLELLRSWLRIVQFIALAILSLFLGFYVYWFRVNRENTFAESPGLSVLIWFGLISLDVGSIIALIFFQIYKDLDVLQIVFGGAAILIWLFMEFGALIENWRKNLAVLRSLSIIIGCIFLFSLTIWVGSASVNNPVTEYRPSQWFLFSASLVLTTQATLAGIAMAANSTARKRAEEIVYVRPEDIQSQLAEVARYRANAEEIEAEYDANIQRQRARSLERTKINRQRARDIELEELPGSSQSQ